MEHALEIRVFLPPLEVVNTIERNNGLNLAAWARHGSQLRYKMPTGRFAYQGNASRINVEPVRMLPHKADCVADVLQLIGNMDIGSETVVYGKPCKTGTSQR